MRILVTGATGFIGRNLIPHLLHNNHEVTILVREKYSLGSAYPSPLDQLRSDIGEQFADLRNLTLTKRAIQQAQPDTIIHLAAVGATNPFLKEDLAIRHNVYGTIHLLKSAFEHTNSVQRVIIARTPGERSAMNTYSATKAAAWNFCQMYARTRGWPIVGAMIFQAYGQWQPDHLLIPSATRTALADEDFAMTSGQQQRDWIAVSDVVAGLEAMTTHDLPTAATVELGTGVATSVAGVVQQIYQLVAGEGQPQIGVLPSRPGEETRQVATKNQSFEWQAMLSLKCGLQQYIDHLHRS